MKQARQIAPYRQSGYVCPMRLVTLFMLLFFCTAAGAELYRWVDEEGRVHFSDRPLDDSAETYTPAPILVVPAGPTAPRHPTPRQKVIRYESLSVTSPASDQVFTPEIQSVAVGVELQPALQAGHVIVLYFDGNSVSRGSSTGFTLSDLYRGTHTVYATVEDDGGKTLIRSEPVQFHVQRHRL